MAIQHLRASCGMAFVSYHCPRLSGFGNSEQPPLADFDYTFENIANLVHSFVEKKGIQSYTIYLMDYGAPIGLRIALKEPKRLKA